MQSSPLITLSPSSPSFNSYSSSKLAEIAARVVQEFSHESESDSINDDDNIFSWHDEDRRFLPVENVTAHQKDNELQDRKNEDVAEDDDDDDEEFEFAVVCQETEISPISADDIFYNGQIRPMYPVFNTDLLLNDHLDHANPSSNSKSTVEKNQPKKSHRLPLRKLFDEERLETASCSSSEADELDGVMPGTYCVWTPKKAEEPPGSCKKSSSTGSSKRWKFRDLLYRSNSDGKDTFVFFTPNSCKKSGGGGEEVKDNSYKLEKGQRLGKGVEFEEHYAKSRAMKEGDKRRSVLPYRQDLVGFLANVHGVGRNLNPF